MQPMTLFKNKPFTSAILLAVVFGSVLAWQVYAPKSFSAKESIIFSLEKGEGSKHVALELESLGIIKSDWALRLYSLVTGQAKYLQAGLYEFSPSMSVASIVDSMASGKIATQRITIPEGWDAKTIGAYLQSRGFYTKENFLALIGSDLSSEFSALKSKPKTVNLEGYLFPDTYRVPVGTSTEDMLRMFLKNFDTRMTPELRQEIAAQRKTIFQIVTMASLLEKEVRDIEDKKIVAGILWKRIAAGMPLQVDATVNYATGKSVARVALADTLVDSRYNTYKYYGLPKGPIANPGMDSIMAAIYPTKSEYWYYLSASGTGQTVFSKTFQEHTKSITQYLR